MSPNRPITAISPLGDCKLPRSVLFSAPKDPGQIWSWPGVRPLAHDLAMRQTKAPVQSSSPGPHPKAIKFRSFQIWKQKPGRTVPPKSLPNSLYFSFSHLSRRWRAGSGHRAVRRASVLTSTPHLPSWARNGRCRRPEFSIHKSYSFHHHRIPPILSPYPPLNPSQLFLHIHHV